MLSLQAEEQVVSWTETEPPPLFNASQGVESYKTNRWGQLSGQRAKHLQLQMGKNNTECFT